VEYLVLLEAKEAEATLVYQDPKVLLESKVNVVPRVLLDLRVPLAKLEVLEILDLQVHTVNPVQQA